MFTVSLENQADILEKLLQLYYPEGAKIIDFTYGTGAIWWSIFEKKRLNEIYDITKTDAEPSIEGETIHKLDLTKDDYSFLGPHDIGVFDPPYLIGRPCHSASTRTIVRDKGVINYSEAEVGDMVLSINSLGEVEWTPIVKIFENDYKGKIYDLKSSVAEFHVTPNHRVMLRDGSYVEAQDLRSNKRYFVPLARLGKKRKRNHSFELMESLAHPLEFFYGWYVAEGWLTETGKLKKYPANIHFAINENDLTYLKPVLETLNLKARLSRRQGEFKEGILLSIGNSRLWVVLSSFGRKASGKKIPRWFLDTPEENRQRAFLHGYLLGDGHAEGKWKWTFGTKSKQLTIDLIELCTRLGFAINIRRRTNAPRLGSDGLDFGGIIRAKNSGIIRINTSEYKGKTWCFETKNGNFAVVGGVGKIAFSGNSFDYPASSKVLNSNISGTQVLAMQFQGKRSWSAKARNKTMENGINRFVANMTLETFNERVRGVLRVAPTVLKNDGLLLVKIMNPRNKGQMIDHVYTIKKTLEPQFSIYDELVYIRQGATTWKVKGHLQNLHGFWLIFQKKSERSLA